MYNLIEYSVSYSSTSGSLWHFGRDEIINNADVTNDDNAPKFKHKASLIGNTEDDGTRNAVKIAVPLKYLSNFWRSLEMPLINCKIELSLKWYETCLLTAATTANFKITDAKLYVPIVTLTVEDNSNSTNKRQIEENKIVQIATNNDIKFRIAYKIKNCLIQAVKVLIDYLFLLMIIQQVIIKFLLIVIKNTFFQE